MSDLWILAGQSNMEGCGPLVDVETPDPRIQVFAHGDHWRVADEPLHRRWDSLDPVHWDAPESDLAMLREERLKNLTNGAGCGLSFAKHLLAEAGIAVKLIPCAHGGTSMDQWSPTKKDTGGKSLYGAMIRRARAALRSGDTLKGVLWYQGESDGYPEASAVYAQEMTNLVAASRADLNAPALPFIVVQLGCLAVPLGGPNPGSQSWTTIREQQRILSHQLPNVFTVPAIDLDLSDLIHVSTAGLKRLGRRLANTALAGVYGINSPMPLDVESIRFDGGNVRVTIANVTGKLFACDPAGRVPGFSVSASDGVRLPAVFHAHIAEDGCSVLVYPTEPLKAGDAIAYGAGHGPFCQLVDTADHAVPAFGPLPIEA